MKNFFKELPDATSRSLTGRFCRSIACDVEIPVDLEKDLDAGNFKSLCARSVAYSYGDSVTNIIGIRQFLAFFGKNSALSSDDDRKRLAYDKFVKSEENCRIINRRFRAPLRPWNKDVESILFIAQRKIASILGPLPGLEQLQFSFGPGSNSNVKKNTSARWKLSVGPTCSTNMLSIISDILSELPILSSFWATNDSDESWTVPVQIDDGQLMFVAKNALTDRTIIVEPSLNTLVQKGVGSYMKHRLMMRGVNLFDQNESIHSNRQRARLASIRNDLMTVDLSGASDSIAKLLVMDLLPFEWYDFLSSIRTSRVMCKEFGSEFELEKFSSMGNGFTFELESLIFYAITTAVCEFEGVIPDVSIYGDDIIAPKDIFRCLTEVFDAIGFSVNPEKSYIDGPFRESCGGDYFLGQDVRPYYQKSNWSVASLFSFHNFMVRKGINFILPSLFKEVLSAIPPAIRIYGPDGYGDGHLIGDWKPIRKNHHRWWGGWIFHTYIQVPRSVKGYLLPGDYILPFYSAYVGSGGGNHFAVRGASGRCKKISIYTLSRQ